MPLSAESLKLRYQRLVASGDDAEFFRLLNEANERLLFSGRYHWVREPMTLAVVDSAITLPEGYHSIVGARINGVAVGANWEESEWFEGGPGEFIPVEGAAAFLVDQGLSYVDEDDKEAGQTRSYKLTSSHTSITEVDVLARYAPGTIEDESSLVLCPSPAAVKQMLYAIVYEESNDTKLSEEYRAKALRELAEHEAAHRGIAKRVFKPSMFRPARRRSRHNFP
jgi:hypothetical protein